MKTTEATEQSDFENGATERTEAMSSDIAPSVPFAGSVASF